MYEDDYFIEILGEAPETVLENLLAKDSNAARALGLNRRYLASKTIYHELAVALSASSWSPHQVLGFLVCRRQVDFEAFQETVNLDPPVEERDFGYMRLNDPPGLRVQLQDIASAWIDDVIREVATTQS